MDVDVSDVSSCGEHFLFGFCKVMSVSRNKMEEIGCRLQVTSRDVSRPREV
jgi:hypothetical protein